MISVNFHLLRSSYTVSPQAKYQSKRLPPKPRPKKEVKCQGSKGTASPFKTVSFIFASAAPEVGGSNLLFCALRASAPRWRSDVFPLSRYPLSTKNYPLPLAHLWS